MNATARRFGPPKGHGRFDYSAIGERMRFQWPGGAKLAFYIGCNLEHFAFGEGLGAALVPSSWASEQPDVPNYTWREYGNRVGVWRCLDLFDDLSLPVGALVNAAMYDHCPQVVMAFAERGDELIAHGHTNAERQGGWPPDEERALLAHCRERMRQAHGRAPQGWLSPWISESALTPDLLHETGYRYTLNWSHDDQPVPMRVRSGARFVSVPYSTELNDVPVFLNHFTGADFVAMAKAQFDVLYREGADSGRVMCLAIHPYLMGTPQRARHLEQILDHVNAHDQVWHTTAGEIAEHFLAYHYDDFVDHAAALAASAGAGRGGAR